MLGQYVLVACAAYLIGSIPFGLIVGRRVRGVDIREFGSGKTGFTNSLRTIGLAPSILVLAGDFLKGAVPVLMISFYSGGPTLQVVAATMAVVGHIWPIFAGFKGGRGVTTALGATAAMMPALAIIILLVGVGVAAVYRYMSLMSIVGTCSGVVLVWILVLTGRAPLAFGVWGLIAGSIILFAHRENFLRLRNGTEPKIGQGGSRRARPGNVSP
jgi:acyl phosphate:glycerol-3-phosphate acyltransferase